MAYIAHCDYEKGWGPWSDPDYEKCGWISQKKYHSRQKAEHAARRHKCRFLNGKAAVKGVDGRRLKTKTWGD